MKVSNLLVRNDNFSDINRKNSEIEWWWCLCIVLFLPNKLFIFQHYLSSSLPKKWLTVVIVLFCKNLVQFQTKFWSKIKDITTKKTISVHQISETMDFQPWIIKWTFSPLSYPILFLFWIRQIGCLKDSLIHTQGKKNWGQTYTVPPSPGGPEI